MKEALLAYAHFLCIFALVAMLAGELILFRRTLPGAVVKRLQMIDRWYGITAGLVIVTGLMRLFMGSKGAAFYTGNPVFWTKMGLFLCIALLSILPTVAFVRWNARLGTGGSISLEGKEYRTLRTVLYAELALLFFIPLCATFMARGL